MRTLNHKSVLAILLTLLAAISPLGILLFIPADREVAASLPDTWVGEIVGGSVDYAASLAFDSYGNPAIACKTANGSGGLVDISYAHYDGVRWSVEKVGPAEGRYSETTRASISLAIDSRNRPAIAYWGVGGLEYAWKTDGGWATEIIDENAPFCISLAFDRQDNPAVICDGLDLRYAYRSGASWVVETWVKCGMYAEASPSLVFDDVGNPSVAYVSDPVPGNAAALNYVHWNGSAWETQVVAYGEGWGASLALDHNGNPALSYLGTSSITDPWGGSRSRSVRYANWNGAGWDVQTVDDGIVPWGNMSLAFQDDGSPAICYAEQKPANNISSERVKYAHWTGTLWEIEVVDSDGQGDVSLAFDPMGNPAIAYHYTYPFLKYAVNRNLLARFTADSAITISEGQDVVFADTSLGEIDYWQWDFGDGTPTVEWIAETRPPDGKIAHVYASKGNCTVSLTVGGPKGSHTETKSDYVSVYAPQDVEAWAVVIGVSDYKNFGPATSFPLPWENYDLTYMDDGALNLAKSLSPIWGEDHVKLLVDADAGKAGIESAVLDWLAPREGPEDIVLFYFAGHGTSRYLCTYDSLDTSYANDISSSGLNDLLDALDSERIVVILDSCESGGVADDLAKPGRVILAASAANESAWEVPDLGSGVFTHYLLESLDETSLVDTDGDHRISAEEMFQNAGPRVVSYISDDSEVQHPQLLDDFTGELDLFSLATITFGVSHQPISLTMDGAELNTSQLPTSYTWIAGTTHSLSVPEIVQSGEGTRYVFYSWSDGNASASRTLKASEAATLMANYTRQYYLTVESERGTTEGEGWYDEGSEGEVSLDGGAAWYRVFAGWAGDSTDTSPTVIVLMDGPKVITAIWKIPLTVWLMGGAVGLILVSLSTFILKRFGGRLWRWTWPNFGVDFRRLE